jgi:hypothetical protein
VVSIIESTSVYDLEDRPRHQELPIMIGLALMPLLPQSIIFLDLPKRLIPQFEQRNTIHVQTLSPRTMTPMNALPTEKPYRLIPHERSRAGIER